MIALTTALIVFCLGDQDFTPIEEFFSSSLADSAHAWVAHAPHAHEILLLDPDASPLLSIYYEKNREAFILAAEQSMPALFHSICTVLHKEIFTNVKKPRECVYEVIEKWGRPCIPLDAFIEDHCGVCRHFVFTAAYFFARMQKEQLLPLLNMRIIRDNLHHGGRHAWMQIGTWHFDPYWNLNADWTDSSHRDFLYHVYGSVGIENYKILGETDHAEDDSMLR